MKKLHVIVAAVAFLAVAAGVGYASIPSSSGTISACRDNKGVLRVIDAEAGQTCANNQQLLTWNQQGPAGPPGPAGISGYETVIASADTNGDNEATATVQCPPGKVILGGGANIHDADSDGVAFLVDSMPFGNGWRAEAARNWDTQQSFTVTVRAICAIVS